MKELKFREWKPEHQEFFYFDLTKNHKIWIDKLEGNELYQYTGMQDKKGVDIYVGDIVKYKLEMTNETIIEEVKIDNLIYGCDIWRWDEYSNGNTDTSTIEIIGNIHQNKDLI